MKLGRIYELFVKEAINNDPRGISGVKEVLARNKKEYRLAQGLKKKYFDKESFSNPYADSRILFGDRGEEVSTILVGIDIEVSEILLADRLKDDKKIDLVITHHPSGRAYANFYEVMDLHIGILNKAGIPLSVAKELSNGRKKEVERRVIGANHTRVVDAAKLLGIPFMCAHTVADNCVSKYLQGLMNSKKPRTLADVLKILDGIPEYSIASCNNAAPRILIGDDKKPAGKILVDMTGGTEGSKEVFARLSQAGIGTLICMHLSEEHYKVAKEQFINVVIAGHISSDNLGLNLLLDKVEQKESLNTVCCSGFYRVKRK